MPQRDISQTLALCLGVFVLSFLFGLVALAWTEPTEPPPGGNVPEPINVGGTAQRKTGALRVGGFISDSTVELARVSGAVRTGKNIWMDGNTRKWIIHNSTGFAIAPSNDEGTAGIWPEGIRISSNPPFNVGIGVGPNPTAKLDVGGQIKITGGAPGTGKVLTSDATGLASWQTITGALPLPSGALGQTLRHDGTSWIANSVIFNNGTNVGIGTTSPGTKLDVFGATDNLLRLQRSGAADSITFKGGTDSAFVVNVGGLDRFTITRGGNVGIGTTSPTSKLHVVGGALIDKLTVGTLDPVYEIDGTEYATYGSDFAGGVRIETSGSVNLNSNGKYEIDFAALEKGSDLWLFWEVSNKNISNLAVLLTPGFEGKVWYQKEGSKLIIYGTKNGEVSYRLTMPRKDYQDWPNEVSQQKSQ